jgi:hypothetical protein
MLAAVRQWISFVQATWSKGPASTGCREGCTEPAYGDGTTNQSPLPRRNSTRLRGRVANAAGGALLPVILSLHKLPETRSSDRGALRTSTRTHAFAGLPDELRFALAERRAFLFELFLKVQ